MGWPIDPLELCNPVCKKRSVSNDSAINPAQLWLFVCQRPINVVAHLSQVDVDGVLQEVRRLSGPLLDGQHPDGFDAGLQLDHAGVLVLRGGSKEGDCRPSVGLIVSMGPRQQSEAPPHNQRECFTVPMTMQATSSASADTSWHASCNSAVLPLLVSLSCADKFPQLTILSLWHTVLIPPV